MDLNIDTIINNFVVNVNFIPPIVLVLVAIAVPLLTMYVLYESNPGYLSNDLKVLFGVAAAVPAVVYLPLKLLNVTWRFQDVAPAEGIFPVLASVAILSVAAVVYLVLGLRERAQERANSES